MPGEMTKLIEKVVTSDSVARKVARSAKVDQQLGAYGSAAGVVKPVADPTAPTGASATAAVASVEVRWDPPDRSEGIVLTRVRKTRTDTSAVSTKVARQTNMLWPVQVYATSHLFEVQHEDAWGRVTSWVTAGTTTPLKSADGDITDVSATKLLNTGSVSLSGAGLAMADLSKGEGSFPSSSVDVNGAPAGGDWIYPGTTPTALPSPHSGIGFFNDTASAPPTRGILIRASGVASTTKEGQIVISADSGFTLPGSAAAAKIQLLSDNVLGRGTIALHGDVYADHDMFLTRDMNVLRDLYVTGEVTAAFNTNELTKGASWSIPSFGGVRAFVQARRFDKIVVLSGVLQNTSGAANVNADVINSDALPTAYRPPRNKFCLAAATSAATVQWDQNRRVTINTAGEIRLSPAAGNSLANGEWLSLDGITYSVA